MSNESSSNQTQNSSTNQAQTSNHVSQAIDSIGPIIQTIKAIKDFIDDKEVDEFWHCLPSEAENEKKLAKERKDNGDSFYPNYDECVATVDEAQKKNCHFTVKAKTHKFTKWGWCCCCENNNN